MSALQSSLLSALKTVSNSLPTNPLSTLLMLLQRQLFNTQKRPKWRCQPHVEFARIY